MAKLKMSLRAARINRGMTQAEAAKEIGVFYQTISRWESGKSHPTTAQFAKLCKVYGVTEGDIFLP